MKPSIQVEVVVAFGNYRVGDIISPDAMLRQQLLTRGWIRVLAPKPQETTPRRNARKATA